MGSEWETTTVGALLERDGGSVKTGPFGTVLKSAEYSTDGVPLISVGEVGYGFLEVRPSTPRAPREVVERLPEYLLESGDIVFGRKGAIDRSAHVRAEQAGWFLGSDGIRLRVPATCDSRFVAYHLQSPSTRAWLIQHATGTTMPSLNQRIIERIPIVLPPLGEQRHIADVLSALDDKIDLNRRMSQTLESIARSLFDASFPVGTFESVPLSDLVESIRDQISPFEFPDRAFDHYSLPAFDDSQTPVREPGVGIMSAKWRVPEDALLISRLNPQIERVWMPDVASDAESVCSTEFLVLRAVQPYTRPFVYCLVRSEGFQEQIRSVVTGTTGSHQRAPRDAVLSLPAMAPAPQRVKWFDSVTSPMLSRALQARRGRAELVAIRDAVLPKLLSGDVPSSTDQEPAALE